MVKTLKTSTQRLPGGRLRSSSFSLVTSREEGLAVFENFQGLEDSTDERVFVDLRSISLYFSAQSLYTPSAASDPISFFV